MKMDDWHALALRSLDASATAVTNGSMRQGGARGALWTAACVLLAAAGFSRVALADAESATVTPTYGGNGVPLLFGHAGFDLVTVGYAQSEFFLEGTARAHAPADPLTNDGKWNVTPVAPAAYRTRLVVNRPIDPRAFNGSVVVEWLNVSGGADASPDWQHMHVELIRQGYAWVGVSAQSVGLNQLKCAAPGAGCPAAGDPLRYASLLHPGDSYSYDIFSQAGQAIRDQRLLVLDGLVPERLIAVGESQSAWRLTTYINAAHPLVLVYDAFVVHSRGAGGAALTQAPLPAVPTPVPTYIRNDLDVPVMVFQAENDTGALLARQPDGALFRLWEVAGTAHFDHYGLIQAGNDRGEQSSVAGWFDSMLNPSSDPSPSFSCQAPINTGPATFVMRALVRALDAWLVDGTPPPMAERLQTNSIAPVQYAVDAYGNVLGGIRTPAVDTPVARINGLGQPAGGTGAFCFLFGVTAPFTTSQLLELYGNHGGFVSEWTRATRSAVNAGFLLHEDAQQMRAVAAKARILNRDSAAGP